MQYSNFIRQSLQSCPWIMVLGSALSFYELARADRFPPDAVETFQRTLRGSPDDLDQRDPAVARKIQGLVDDARRNALVQERDRLMAKTLAAITRLSDMRRAILLTDWPSDESQDPVGKLDIEHRRKLVEAFRSKVRAILKAGSPAETRAVLESLGESAVATKVPGDKKGLGRAFGPDIVELLRSSRDSETRAAAARALGQLLADPDLAAPALARELRSASVSERRAAAQGLLGLVQIPYQLTTGRKSNVKVEAESADVLVSARLATLAAAGGTADPDVEVRRHCTDTIRMAVAGVLTQIPRTGAYDIRSPVLDRPAEEALRRQIQTCLKAFAQNAEVIGRALRDADPAVRLLAGKAAEDLGMIRQRLQQSTSSPDQRRVPARERTALDKQLDGSTQFVAATSLQAGQADDDVLADALRLLVPSLVQRLSDASLEQRLRAIDALESIGSVAVVAAPALVKSLKDSDRFVRWGAVRTLGKLGPVAGLDAVRPISELLKDGDLDVNLAAAAALEAYGPAASAAVQPLVKLFEATDAENRQGALKALEGIGTESCKAIPEIIRLIDDPDANVRQAAARLLGKLGPAAASAVPALQKALIDPVADVRRSASDALLNILHK